MTTKQGAKEAGHGQGPGGQVSAKKLTPVERGALKAVRQGGDVYDYGIALILRRLSKSGLVTITRPMGSPHGARQLPYFGAIATAKGLKACGIATPTPEAGR